MLSLLSKNVFGRFMTQSTTPMMTIRGVASKPNKTAKLKGALKVKKKKKKEKKLLLDCTN
jgi:hypothetical protein